MSIAFKFLPFPIHTLNDISSLFQWTFDIIMDIVFKLQTPFAYTHLEWQFHHFSNALLISLSRLQVETIWAFTKIIVKQIARNGSPGIQMNFLFECKNTVLIRIRKGYSFPRIMIMSIIGLCTLKHNIPYFLAKRNRKRHVVEFDAHLITMERSICRNTDLFLSRVLNWKKETHKKLVAN